MTEAYYLHATMDKPYQAPQGRMLSTLIIFVFTLTVLYTLSLLFQQFQLNRELSQNEADIVEIEQQMEALREQSIEELFVAQTLKDQVEANAVIWSRVIRKLQDLTPVTVFFSSYSGSSDGSIQVNGLGDSYDSVADVIDSLETSSDFDEVFVPSVTLGSTGEGAEVVSFSLTINSVVE